MRRLLLLIIIAAAQAACLEPLVSDEIPPGDVFGSGTPETAPLAEALPRVQPNLHFFTQQVAYLRGFASGAPVWYWNVDGANSKYIAPMYVVLGKDGQIGLPIIDVLPGDVGYTPWWRRTVVRTTDKYQGEKIWSRAAVDAGVRLGILSEPEPTTSIVNCPVALQGTTFEVGNGLVSEASRVWYRNTAAYWIQFKETLDVPLESREMPRFPVYVLQRIDSAAPLYEFATGVDLNGDRALNASNNIFAGGLDEARYSPLWFASFVRVAADVRSVDTSTVPELTRESQLVDANGQPVSSRVISVAPAPDALINCPIQRAKGEL